MLARFVREIGVETVAASSISIGGVYGATFAGLMVLEGTVADRARATLHVHLLPLGLQRGVVHERAIRNVDLAVLSVDLHHHSSGRCCGKYIPGCGDFAVFCVIPAPIG